MGKTNDKQRTADISRGSDAPKISSDTNSKNSDKDKNSSKKR